MKILLLFSLVTYDKLYLFSALFDIFNVVGTSTNKICTFSQSR